MKLIYLLLLIILIIYLVKSQKSEENFEEDNDQNKIRYYNGINQYDILDTSKIIPILTNNNNTTSFPGYDKENDFWEIKSVGFSNLFNYQDDGGFEVVNQSESSKYNDFINGRKMLKEVIQKEIPKNAIKYENKFYNLIGTASNPYYFQYYYLYEHQIEPSDTNLFMKEELEYINYQVYEYLLVKLDNNNPVIVHTFGPRTKINLNDMVYLTNGNFQLGPLTIKS